jgi:hypothetical protein
MKVKAKNLDLTKGSIVQDILIFTLPILLGQLQQLYNLVDAWVVGNFADNDAFAAVSSGGSLKVMLICMASFLLPRIRRKTLVEVSVGIRKTYQKAAKSELIQEKQNGNIKL